MSNRSGVAERVLLEGTLIVFRVRTTQAAWFCKGFIHTYTDVLIMATDGDAQADEDDLLTTDEVAENLGFDVE